MNAPDPMRYNLQSYYENKIYDLCIIGGGASGLAMACSVSYAMPEAEVVIIEKNEVLGRKLRSTGNGRCNITNTDSSGYLDALRFFKKTGIATRTYPNGLVYPYSESAQDVADLLAAEVRGAGFKVLTDAEVTGVKVLSGTEGINRLFVTDVKHNCKDGTFDKHIIRSKVLSVATGGKAAPHFGTTGYGYDIARAFGHRIIKPIPILTGIECSKNSPEEIAGIRARGIITLLKDGCKVFEESGEIQFTKYGLSGICVFNMTRFMRFGRGESIGNFEAMIDLCPGEDLRKFLMIKAADGTNCNDALLTVIKPKLAGYVLRRIGVTGKLNREKANKICAAVHSLKFKPTAIRGWKDAQCTSGGVDLEELTVNMESKKVPGLYFVGEVVDYDGPCGGYNLTNAWLNGVAAAEDFVRKF